MYICTLYSLVSNGQEECGRESNFLNKLKNISICIFLRFSLYGFFISDALTVKRIYWTSHTQSLSYRLNAASLSMFFPLKMFWRFTLLTYVR